MLINDKVQKVSHENLCISDVSVSHIVASMHIRNTGQLYVHDLMKETGCNK